jgi:hypothetical protein
MDPQQLALVPGKEGMVPAQSRAGGAGLELALCRRLMRWMKREMEIGSRTGRAPPSPCPESWGKGGGSMASPPAASASPA